MECSSGPLQKTLEALAEPIAQRKKAPSHEVSAVIVALCAKQALRLEELENLLKRSGESLRKKYLQQLIKDKRLRRLYATKPNHPEQAYITVGSAVDKEHP